MNDKGDKYYYFNINNDSTGPTNSSSDEKY